MDRVEKLIEGLGKAQRETAAQQRESETRQRETAARHDREIAESRALARKTERLLASWTRLGVTEARNQRKRSRILDEKITQLAAAQLVTEEKLQRFISSLGASGAGYGHEKRR